MSTYALIQNGIVINTIIADSSDVQDPAYTWVDVTSINSSPQIGWTYDGTLFAQPGLPNDAYGNAVTFSTDGITDTYVVNAQKYSFPAGTAQNVAYLAIAKSENLALFSNAVSSFVTSRYPLETRFNFIALYTNAQQNSLSNRLAYISKIFTWTNSVTAYCANYIAGINAATSDTAVASTVWNFSSLISSDPLISPFVAIQIPN